METYMDIALANAKADSEELFSKADLKDLIDELDFEETIEVTNFVMELLSYNYDYDYENNVDYEWDELDDDGEITEKMSNDALRQAAKKRRTPAFKKVARLKAKCEEANRKRLEDSNGKLVCNSRGKVQKGMKKAEKIKLAKARKRNSSKITK